MTKKKANKAKPKTERKVAPVRELSDEELSQVAGGTDLYMKLDGIKGETTQKSDGSVLDLTLTTYGPIRKF
jgi:bacteriocin-like protein